MDFLVDLHVVRGKKYSKGLLKDVQVNPKFNYNRVSITKLLSKVFHLVADSNELYIVQYYNKKELHFSFEILTDTIFLLGAYLVRVGIGVESATVGRIITSQE